MYNMYSENKEIKEFKRELENRNKMNKVIHIPEHIIEIPEPTGREYGTALY